MSKPIVTVGAIVAAVVSALLGLVGGVVGLGLRRRWPFVLDGLRRLSRTFINPRQMITAGETGASASIIEHRGRVSGTLYRTPIVVRPIDSGFVISLTYGERADWVKNVLASGSANLVHDGTRHDALIAEVVELDDADSLVSPGERRALRWFGIETCLRLTPGS